MKSSFLFVCYFFCYFGTFAQETALDRKIQKVEKLLDHGLNEHAIVILDSLIDRKPSLPDPHFLRALAKEEIGDLHGALDDYNQLIALEPYRTDGLFGRGVIRYRLGHYAFAKDDFLSVLNLPDGPTTSIYYEQPNYKSGVSQVMTRQSGKKDHIYQLLGLCCKALNQWEKAESYFGKAITLNPGNADYFLNRGRLFQSRGIIDKAKIDYRTALELYPNHPIAHQYLAEMASKEADPLNAELFFTKAIEEEPDWGYSYKQRGYSRLMKKDYKNAKADFERALELEPEDKESKYYLAFVFEKTGKQQLALAAYEEILAVDEKHYQAFFGKGNILFAKKDFETAHAAYSLAVYHNPKFAEAFYQRGITSHYLGNKSEACRDLLIAQKMGLVQASSAIQKICEE